MGICFSVWYIYFIACCALMVRGNKQTFFPSGDPNFVYVYLKLPVGTDVKYTDSVTHVLEKRVYESFGKRKTRRPKEALWKVLLPMWP